MLKKEILVIAIILFVSTAYGFQVQIDGQDRAATPENPLEIDVNVENTADEPRTYRPDLINNRYGFLYIPSTTQTVQPGNQTTFTLSASPGNDVLNDNYQYNIKIDEQETGNSQTITNYVSVDRENDLQLVYTNTDQASYEPGDQIALETEVKNYGTRSYTDYNITAKTLNQTNTEEGLDITREAERRYTHRFQTNNRTPPGSQKITIILEKDGEETTIGERQIEISEKPIIETETQTSNQLIRSTETKKITNTGNSETTHTIETSLNPFLEPITTFNIEQEEVENGEQETKFTHTLKVEPGEEKSLIKTVRYWIPATALILLVGMVATISKLREDISFKKQTELHDNGDIKVQLEINNNTGKKISDIEIEDYIPNIAKVNEEFPTAKPKIRKKKEGTQLTWTIEELEPNSQRLITYKITPVVEVEEGATLDPAELKKQGETIQKTKEKETKFKPT